MGADQSRVMWQPLEDRPDNDFWEFMERPGNLLPPPPGSDWISPHRGDCAGPSVRWIGNRYFCRACAMSLYNFGIEKIYEQQTADFSPSMAYPGPTSPVFNYPTPRGVVANPTPRQNVPYAAPILQQYPKNRPAVPTGIRNTHSANIERYNAYPPENVAYAVAPMPTHADAGAQSSPYGSDLIGDDSISSHLSSKSRRRRGSQSSDGSSASSSFRECFSSSSSGSDDGRDIWTLAISGQAAPVLPSPSLSRRVTGALGLGKTQRKVRRLVDALLAFGSRKPTESLDSARSAAQDAAVALVSLSTNPRNRAEVVRRLSKGAATRAQTLKALCALSDSIVDTDVPLQGSSIEAQLMNMVMEVPKMGPTVAAYLADPSITVGAAGIRHLIKTMPPTMQQIPSFDNLLLLYVNRLALRQQRADASEDENHPTWLSFRLLELLLRRRIIHVSQLKPGTLFMVNYSISLFPDNLTPYHVIRSFVGAPPPGFRPDTMYLPLYGIVTTSPESYGGTKNNQTRCLAFSALALMLRDDYCSPKEDGGVLLRIIVDVLLWKTRWQHSIPKRISRNWDIPEVIPHDDAYAMLSLFSPSKFFPMFRNEFMDAISSGSSKILEPLMALIVDHSADPDAFWPTMLSALIQAGLVDYLMSMAVSLLPGQGDRLYRVVQEAKRDAVTGVLRCFEQISQADSGNIGWGVFDALEQLIRDQAQPLPVQDIAKIALRTWDQRMGGVRPLKPFDTGFR
ncbi:hypothetical protein FRB94_009318 [Tulasnella sp. JGI-2019a]|nr:hypothetical protein FRB93_008851 [Tulasnella sp. JGI-2019a]KAG8995243.1 hypothetical protein FRB94_009318 [Tulasnella sp. JGI-2019a]KAG9028456.1 hypothetical protein FRB95_006488 [Tulasnella sp. JGI-2019a]